MVNEGIGSWHRTHYSTDVSPDLEGEEVTVFGWITEIRDLGGIRFLVLRDCRGILQVTVPQSKVSQDVNEKAAQVQKQYVIGVRGTVKAMENAPNHVELIPREMRILSTVRHPLPLDPSGRVPADLDVRLNARILDLRRPENQALFRIRHTALNAIRSSLLEMGFMEVNTPKIIATATEGGASLFPVAYFDREAFLAQSPQLYKESLTSVFEKVFEIAPFFRAEESNTTRHISEFISVDIEEAFVTREEVMQTLEELTCRCFETVMERCSQELKVLKHRLEIPRRPFPRYTYDEVLEALNKTEGLEIPWGEDIPTPAMRSLGKLHPGFNFIVDWPSASKPFYILTDKRNPEICEAFDLMHGWIELASGGTRVSDKETLISRMRQQGLNPPSFEYYLRSFDYGMPPHAGWGLGLDRLIMALTGKSNIREVVLFPRDRYRLTP